MDSSESEPESTKPAQLSKPPRARRAEPGAAKAEAAKAGAARTGATKAGASKTGASKAGAAKPRRKQTERSDDMRARLLRAAVKVMVKRGYSGFRTAEVSKVAGVSRGGQIHHYPTKDSLVTASLEHVFAQVSRQSQDKARARMDDASLLTAIVDDAREFFFSEEFLIAVDILISSGKNAKNTKMRKAVRSISAEHRMPAEAAWAERLAQTGLPRDVAEDVLWMLWSVIRGLAVRELITKDEARIKTVTDLALRLAGAYADEVRRNGRAPVAG